VEGYVWTKLAAEQGFPKAIANLSEMSGALAEDERERADERVTRFEPKGNKGSDATFDSDRGTKGAARPPMFAGAGRRVHSEALREPPDVTSR